MIMKIFSIGCAMALLCSSCATMDRPTRTAVATQTGAIVGGSFGAALGDQIGGRHGSFWGSMLGSVAGIAVGAAAASAGDQQPDRHVSRVQIQPAPSLAIKDIILKDRNGNRCIDAGESCQISFVIINNGDMAAHNVTPYIKAKNSNAKKIRLSSPASIRRISLDDEIGYTVHARAATSLKSGSATFEVIMEDGNGYELCREQFSVYTRGASKR